MDFLSAAAVYSRRSLAFARGAESVTLTVEAIYENGVLKPIEPLPFKEHEKVAFPSLT
jgi:hypothetical protein